MKKQTMMTEYFSRQEELSTRYGEKAVVLYQCGGFYEVYEEKMCKCDRPKEPTPVCPRLCPSCNMVASGEKPRGKASVIEHIWNVHKPSKTRWWMVGFPSDNSAAFVRHIGVLIKAGWTVAVYKQHDGSGAGRLSTTQEKVRVLDKIYSKGTFGKPDDGLCTSDNHTTMCIYVRRSENFLSEEPTDMFEIGVATYAIDTQSIACGEVYTTEKDQMLPFARLRSLLCESTPTEYLLVCDGIDVEETRQLLRSSSITLPNDGVARVKDKRLQHARVREAVFTKMFRCGRSSGVPVTQRIGVARHEVTAITLAELVTFLEHHDRSLVDNLPIPTRLLDTDHLILHTTALCQLDVLPNPALTHNKKSGIRCLMDVVNTCITSSGRRLLHRRVCRPATDPDVICNRQQLVEAFLSCTPSRNKVTEYLRQIRGMSRVSSSLRSGKITYKQVAILVKQIEATTASLAGPITEICKQHPKFEEYLSTRLPHTDWALLSTFPDTVRDIFDLARIPEVTTADIERVSCFQPGYDSSIDNEHRVANDIIQYLKGIADAIRSTLPAVKLGGRRSSRAMEDHDLVFVTTAKSDKRKYLYELTTLAQKARRIAIRGSTGNASIVSAPLVVHRAFESEGISVYPDNKTPSSWTDEHAFHTYTGRGYVQFRWQEVLVRELQEIHRRLIELTQKRFNQIKQQLCDRYYDSLERLCCVVDELDVAVSSAATAFAYNYSRPSVSKGSERGASVEIKGLRHPIIERIDSATAYVANDIVFDSNTPGYLVHGVNAAGKSSLMKSVGLAVIMAQAGMYVPASSMVLHPYQHLFTRITKSDDLFNGLSSFQVEMLELGTILRRCTNESLVIGDEICSGTETVSAVGIVGASVVELVETGTHFMFATHLHELRRIRDIYSDHRIRSVHMQVDVDASGVMTYTRKLADGPGPDTYGIEACTGIIALPDRFLRNARRFRHIMTTSPESQTEEASALVCSSYNSSVLSGPGHTCTYPGCTRPAVDVHHLVHQAAANGAGYIRDGRHKNARSNLMLLCKEHHKKVHANGSPAVAAQWVATNTGARITMTST